MFLSEVSATTITVHWSLASKTATGGADFIAQSGILTFNPGITELTIPFVVVNDLLPEPIESFNLVLSSPSSNALVGNNLTFATASERDLVPGTPGVLAGDFGVDEVRPQCFKRSQRGRFVRAHQTAVSDHIGGKNSGQAAFHVGVKIKS